MSNPDTNTKASLGCGSLILIAIIVLIFGNSGSDKELLREIRDMRSEIKELKAEVATQSAILKGIKTSGRRLPAPSPESPELAPE